MSSLFLIYTYLIFKLSFSIGKMHVWQNDAELQKNWVVNFFYCSGFKWSYTNYQPSLEASGDFVYFYGFSLKFSRTDDLSLIFIISACLNCVPYSILSDLRSKFRFNRFQFKWNYLLFVFHLENWLIKNTNVYNL